MKLTEGQIYWVQLGSSCFPGMFLKEDCESYCFVFEKQYTNNLWATISLHSSLLEIIDADIWQYGYWVGIKQIYPDKIDDLTILMMKLELECKDNDRINL